MPFKYESKTILVYTFIRILSTKSRSFSDTTIPWPNKHFPYADAKTRKLLENLTTGQCHLNNNNIISVVNKKHGRP